MTGRILIIDDDPRLAELVSDYLGEAVTTQRDTRYPELTARLIEEFLDAS